MPDLDLEPDPEIADAILTTDASAEGESCASALRARGFHVVDVPLSLLEARAAIGEAPRVIVVDLDQPGALDAVERLRELPAGASAELVCIGAPARAGVLGFDEGSERIFERPVDRERFAALVAKLAAPARARSLASDDASAFVCTAPRHGRAAVPRERAAADDVGLSCGRGHRDRSRARAGRQRRAARHGRDEPFELSKLLSDAEARVSIEPDPPVGARTTTCRRVALARAPRRARRAARSRRGRCGDGILGGARWDAEARRARCRSARRPAPEQSRGSVGGAERCATVLGPPSLPASNRRRARARTSSTLHASSASNERLSPFQRGTGVEPIADAKRADARPRGARPAAIRSPGARSEWPALARAAPAADARNTAAASSRDGRGTGLRVASTEAPPSMTEFEPERSSFGWSSGEQARAPQISPEPSRCAVDVPDAEPPPSRRLARAR